MSIFHNIRDILMMHMVDVLKSFAPIHLETKIIQYCSNHYSVEHGAMISIFLGCEIKFYESLAIQSNSIILHDACHSLNLDEELCNRYRAILDVDSAHINKLISVGIDPNKSKELCVLDVVSNELNEYMVSCILRAHGFDYYFQKLSRNEDAINYDSYFNEYYHDYLEKYLPLGMSENNVKLPPDYFSRILKGYENTEIFRQFMDIFGVGEASIVEHILENCDESYIDEKFIEVLFEAFLTAKCFYFRKLLLDFVHIVNGDGFLFNKSILDEYEKEYKRSKPTGSIAIIGKDICK